MLPGDLIFTGTPSGVGLSRSPKRLLGTRRRAGHPTLLVERHPQTSYLPKAHYLDQRTMEIFRHGLSDELYEVGTLMTTLGLVERMTTLAGDTVGDRSDRFVRGSLRLHFAAQLAARGSMVERLRGVAAEPHGPRA